MIEIFTTPWCGDCIRTKKLLDENLVGYREINVETDQEALEKIKNINDGFASVPTLIFDDGSTLTEPSNQALLEKLGL
jgi:mycoredoxin